MSITTDTLISDLAAGLEPVQPMRRSQGLTIVAAGTVLAVVMSILVYGLRADIAAGHFNPLFLISAGLFLLLGLASAITVIVMAQPRVGADHSGWIWAAAMTALLPLATGITLLSGDHAAVNASQVVNGMDCLTGGILLGIATFAGLLLWLRRGAPTSPERAGLLTGVAAGSIGIFAFSLHCSHNDIVHIGLWHSAVVVISAGMSRLVVPRLIRW